MKLILTFLLALGCVCITYSQLPPYIECQGNSQAVVELDRKNWAPVSDLSEAYQFDFEIPDTPDECNRIESIEFTVDFSDSPAVNDCLEGIYTNVFLNCGTNSPASCGTIWENGGVQEPILSNLNDTYNPGDVIGFDLVAISNFLWDPLCTQRLITDGLYSASIEVCMTVNYELLGPEIDLEDFVEICEGETTSLIGPDDFIAYDWSGTLSGSGQILDNVIEGRYELIVTDENGCTGFDNIEVYSYPSFDLEINASDTLKICDIDNVQDLEAIINGNTNVPGYEYIWTYPDNSISQRPRIAPQLTGDYTLQVIDETTTCAQEAEVYIELGQISVAQINETSSRTIRLCDEDVRLEAFIPTNDNRSYTYQWVYGRDTSYGKFLDVNTDGEYILNLLNDINCPTTSDTVDVIISQARSAGGDGFLTTCPGNGTVDLSLYLASSASTNGQWNDIDGSGGLNGSDLDLRGLTGSYRFEYVVRNNAPCENDTSYIELQFYDIQEELVEEEYCQNESIVINGTRYDSSNPSGREVLRDLNGCDSIVTIELRFLQEENILIDDALCQGQSLTVNGRTYDENNSTGVETLTGSNGCDSIITVDLSFTSAINTDIIEELCTGDFRVVNGRTYDENNPTGQEMLTSVAGCDSLITVDLTFVQSITTPVNEELCDGQSVVINGTTYDQSNTTGSEILQSVSGCDSILDINISFVQSIMTPINEELCTGETLVFNGNTYSESNATGMEILQSTSGCDSILDINLSFVQAINTPVTDELCAGQSLVLNGNTYDENNPVGIEILQSASGCDSILDINLSFVQAITTPINDQYCEGESVIINGHVYDENNNTGTEVLQSVNGCDSILEVNLSFVRAIVTPISPELCPDESIVVNGNTYDISTPTGIETMQSINGCDSILSIDLLFFAETPLTENVSTICPGDSVFVIDEYIYNQSLVLDTLSNANGCDSIIQTQVEITPCDVSLSVVWNDLSCYQDNTGNLEFSISSMNADNYSYSVIGDNGYNQIGSISNNETISFENLDAGNYQVIILDGNTIEVAIESFVIIQPDPLTTTVEVELDILCSGETGDISASAQGGTASYNYLWDNGESDAQLTGIVAGDYTVTVTDDNDCTDEASITLTAPEELSFEIMQTNIPCGATDGGVIEVINISGGAMPYTVSIDGVTFSADQIYEGLSTGNYLVTIKDSNGCELSEAISIISESAQSINPIGPFDITQGESITIDLGLSFSPLSVTWLPNSSLDCSDCEIVTAQPEETTTYTVTVEDDQGCLILTEIIVNVSVVSEPEPEVYLPTIFDPNDQGTINNTFMPLVSSDVELVIDDLSIFDKWGNIVHQESVNVSGWDGRKDQKLVEVGVYVYRIVYSINGVSKVKHGNITIVR